MPATSGLCFAHPVYGLSMGARTCGLRSACMSRNVDDMKTLTVFQVPAIRLNPPSQLPPSPGRRRQGIWEKLCHGELCVYSVALGIKAPVNEALYSVNFGLLRSLRKLVDEVDGPSIFVETFEVTLR
jgi:hypothetical protein